MEYVNLPNSDLKVSPLCVGCWQFNGGQQSADKTWNAMPVEVGVPNCAQVHRFSDQI